MKRAIELAVLGRGLVSTNPMVGCVLVNGATDASDKKIIGESWHKAFGESHAEANAIAEVADKALLQGSTAYVTLEPCSHTGKRPPCANLLIKMGIKRIFIGCRDSFELVAGRGIERLKEAGIEVHVGLLEKECRALNVRFFTFFEQKRPYVILKWAESADGFIAKPNYEAVAISNVLSQKLSHGWRSEEDAIMVGTNTALYDKPRLTTRHWPGKNPIRIIIDSQLKAIESWHQEGAKTLVLNTIKEVDEKNNTTFLKLPDTKPKTIVEALFQQKIQSVLIEGGSKLIESFMQENFFDEIRFCKTQKILQNGIFAPTLPKNICLEKHLLLEENNWYFYSKTQK